MIAGMTREWDAVVIGGGIIGCAIAWELSRAGARTAIVERTAIASGATQASAGVLAPYIEAPREGPLHALMIESLGLYDRFVADLQSETGASLEYRRNGTLEIWEDEATRGRLEAIAAWAAGEGVATEWADGAAVARLEPSLSRTRGALIVPSHGYVDVCGFTEALAEAARRRGAAVIRGSVESLAADGAGVTVTTDGGTIRAGRAVLAAGSWSGALAEAATVTPIRGQLLRLRWPAPRLTRIVWSERCYVVPWTDGTVLVGATMEDVGFDQRATAGGVRALLDAVCELIPAARDATFLEARAGLRPSTADGMPIIRRSTASEAIVIATGHFRNGVLLAPLTAKRVGSLVRSA
jgi:glycine oxidase